ncbi:HD domain-containing protein [Pokkaliibacter sp. MBI-7]|uniref:HD-GYP domain-containing protein n=1 Tax=Pokkaliibacter sp. MBI-7 TaxID=3040600 RepID=UPI00244D1B98|nr:HD domain-containing phosphohydrolase [Pokkaliibacter sp. MBI-7]MDH2436339.1 HD domain-containing protein [Pokkaliibacter sp. MBI-7]
MDNINHFARWLSRAIEQRDLYTEQHGERVGQLAMEVGRACGLSSYDLELLKLSAALHDVGKIGIPDQVLLKPGKLTADEYELMKQHTAKGEYIILGCAEYSHDIDAVRKIAAAVRHHHEFFNGEGYPDRISGEDIPYLSRIVGIVDSFDAMATRRVYQSQRPQHLIMAELEKEAGTKHDPYILRVFFEVLNRGHIQFEPVP